MTVFEDLAQEVNRAWKRHNFEDAHLPEIAVAALQARNLSEEVSVADVCQWAIDTDRFPFQPNLNVDFGQPPLTVYSDGRLYIEILFWLDNTTSIHQHAFSGAFYVLAGSSVHSVFHFEESERVNDRLLVGEVLLDKIEHLKQGDLHPIRSGERYIHSLFHLGYPSATVVVRNYTEPPQQPQYAYLMPSLAFDRPSVTPQMKRTADLFTMMMRIRHPETREMLEGWLRTADAESTFRVLHHLNTKRALSDDMLEFTTQIAIERHGPVMEKVRDALIDKRKVDRVFSMRSRVTDEKHRLFLALMATAPGRERVLEVVQSVYPDENPASLMFSWINDMNAAPETALGFEDVQRLLGNGTPVATSPVTEAAA